jgi:hypothetical protein
MTCGESKLLLTMLSVPHPQLKGWQKLSLKKNQNFLYFFSTLSTKNDLLEFHIGRLYFYMRCRRKIRSECNESCDSNKCELLHVAIFLQHSFFTHLATTTRLLPRIEKFSQKIEKMTNCFELLFGSVLWRDENNDRLQLFLV